MARRDDNRGGRNQREEEQSDIVEKLVHIARHDDVDEFEQALNIIVELIRQRIRHPISGALGGDHSPLSGLPAANWVSAIRSDAIETRRG